MRYLLCLSILLLNTGTFAQSPYSFTPDNPVTEAWIAEHLRSQHPRLLLPPDPETLRQKSEEEGSLAHLHYQWLVANADALLTEPVLERKQVGRRLLDVSREALRRMSTLALVYRVSQDQRYLQRLEAELVAVCRFSDWNPSHFLDVAEMAYAVSLGLDWAYDDLSEETRALARQSLIHQALEPSLPEDDNGWMNSEHNWNQVCHGGLSVAAIMVADEAPALATRIISRALDKLPLALQAYYPDGAYPEGASYWFYATYYTAAMISAFESAFGTDFNLTQSPGLLPSALFSVMLTGPSGDYYDYFDASATGAFSVKHYDILTWFAMRDPQRQYVDTARYRSVLTEAIATGNICHRFAATSLTWLTRFEPRAMVSLPDASVFRGVNPLAIIGKPTAGGRGFYLGAKGGRASLNHGNMDVGSFIFELDGVRWGLDPGNQSYNDLEQIMGRALWRRDQRGRRWTLLTKNNFGHSTLTINDSLHRVDGVAPLVDTSLDAPQPSVRFDLSEALGTDVERAVRTFRKVDDYTLHIVDTIVPNGTTRAVTWNLMTQAAATVTDTGVTLTQDGKTLTLTVMQPDTFSVNVVRLSPPPLAYDKNLPGLKRIEVQILPSTLQTIPLIIQLQGDTL